MVSGTNEVKIRFVPKFFKRTATEIGFDIKSPPVRSGDANNFLQRLCRSEIDKYIFLKR